MTTPAATDQQTPGSVRRRTASRVLLAGMGSEYRSDDGVGPAVVRRVAELGRPAGVELVAGLDDPLDLLGLWDGAELAVVVDATRSGAPAGTITFAELGEGDVAHGRAKSTHSIGFAGALRLARLIGSAPDRVVLLGVEGDDFRMGTWISAPVAAAVPRAAELALSLVRGAPASGAPTSGAPDQGAPACA